MFTPTEERMIRVLEDGHPHTREELHACLDDDLSSRATIKAHISNLRRKLRPLGQTIVCELNGTIKYRHVRLISKHNNGRQ